jgi:DNA-binding MarR family transcriptional regulator
MLSREVWGWRILALLFVALLATTAPHFESLKSEWNASIDGNYSSEEPDSAGLMFENQSSEEESTRESDSDDKASQEDDVSSDGEDVEIAESQPPDDAESTGEEAASPLDSNQPPEWILPATQVIVLSIMSIMAVGLLTSTSVAILTSEAARFSIMLAIIGPLVGLSQRGEGGIFTRGRILGFIEAHPGIHFSALRDALSLGNGVTAHHLQVLEKEGRIISWIDGKVRRFASSGIDQKRLKELQSPVVGMQIAILQILVEHEKVGIKSGELRTKLETSRQLLSYHMKQLSERDFVSSSGRGRALKWSILEKGKRQLENSSHLLLTPND